MEHVHIETKEPGFHDSIENMHYATQQWISEIEFAKVEFDFLKELISEHIIDVCSSDNFNKAQLLIKGIKHEMGLSDELIGSINAHNIRLSLLIGNVYMKREESFREEHVMLKKEIENFKNNFKYLKKEVFDLILFIMKREKFKKII